jgi:hypothetical protein
MVAHLFVDIVDERSIDQQDLAVVYKSGESAAGAQVYQQAGRPALDGVLGRGGGGDLSPSGVEEDQLVGAVREEILKRVGPIAKWG